MKRTIFFEGNKVIVTLDKKEINELIEEGIIFQLRKDEFKFLDNQKNIFIRQNNTLLKENLKEMKGGLKE